VSGSGEKTPFKSYLINTIYRKKIHVALVNRNCLPFMSTIISFLCNVLWIVVCSFVVFLLVLCCLFFCRISFGIVLFVLLSYFFWSLCCLFFFDLRFLITTLVYSNFSYSKRMSVSLFFFNKCLIHFKYYFGL